MKRFYAYIRVSTVKQGEHGISLQEQRSAIETYAQRQDLAIVEWFEEMETAAKRGRPMFSKMLGQLRRGQVDGVIIHKIDRSARNLKDWSDIGELIDQGIDVRFAHESLDMQSRGGRLTADIQAVIAADYIRNLRDEVKKGFYGRLKQGFYPLPAPLGYLDQGKAKAKIPDPIRAPLIRQAFELYATGSHTVEALAAELTRRGLRTREGEPIGASALFKILHRPFYAGLIRIERTGEMFQGIHEPIVPMALYRRVQDVFDGRAFVRTQKHEFLFRRLILCRGCDRVLVGERQKGHVYYRCHRCPGTSLRECHFEEILRRTFTLLRFSNEEVGDLGDEAGKLQADTLQSCTERKKALMLVQHKIDERLTRLTDALLDGLLDKDAYEIRRGQLLSDRIEIIEEINRVGQSATIQDRLSKLLELTQTAYLLYETGSPDEKRDLIKSVSSNLTLQVKYPAIALRSPYQEIVNWHRLYAGEPSRDRARTFLKKLLEMLRGDE